jgi:hypothetical protein
MRFLTIACSMGTHIQPRHYYIKYSKSLIHIWIWAVRCTPSTGGCPAEKIWNVGLLASHCCQAAVLEAIDYSGNCGLESHLVMLFWIFWKRFRGNLESERNRVFRCKFDYGVKSNPSFLRDPIVRFEGRILYGDACQSNIGQGRK